MRILAIDPGTNQSAFVAWDGKLLGYCDIQPNENILSMLALAAESDYYGVIAIEMVASMGMPVGREVFETVLWIGRFIERSPILPRLVYRRDIKLHHCGSARAKDANIRQALIDKYGAPGTKKNPGATYGLKSHLWAAFALATYISETQTEAKPKVLFISETQSERGAVCPATTVSTKV